MFEPAVDRLRRPVGRAGPVEVREDVSRAALERAAELADLIQRGGNPGGDIVDQLLHERLPRGPVGVPVGDDHPLVDAPGRFDLDVLFVGE